VNAVVETPETRKGSPGKVFAVLIVVAILGMWAFVFAYHLSGQWRDNSPGRLDDPSFSAAAAPLCAQAAAELALLPPAWATDTPTARADAVAASVPILDSLVDALEALPTGGDDTVRVNEWLQDWRTYVGDRNAYAERLRIDPETRFYVTQSDRDNRQITVAIDRFASMNRMTECETPADLS
jgi:hypothetical protein